MPLSTTRKIRNIAPRATGERFHRFGEAPKPIRPTADEPLRLAQFEPDDGITVYRRSQATPLDKRAQLERRAVPIEQVYGSIWERIIYKALVERRIEFDFQSSFQGGRRELGGLAADFVMMDRPVIINPLGQMWHKGTANEVRDAVQNDLLRGMGYEVLMIWDYEIEPEPAFEDWMRRHIDVRTPGAVPPETYRLNGTRP
jgi:very-short-patch-repair endonuclease